MSNNRVSDDILDRFQMYLHTESEKSGEITKSLAQMADELKISSATLCRAVKVLEKKGIIKVTPPPVPGLPQRILYLPNLDTSQVDSAKVKVLAEFDALRSHINNLEKLVMSFIGKVDALEAKVAMQSDLEKRVISRARTTDGKIVVIYEEEPKTGPTT